MYVRSYDCIQTNIIQMGVNRGRLFIEVNRSAKIRHVSEESQYNNHASTDEWSLSDANTKSFQSNRYRWGQRSESKSSHQCRAQSIHSINTQKLLETLSQSFAGSNTRDLIAHAANLTKKAFPFNFPSTQQFSQTLPLMASTVSISRPKPIILEPTLPISATIPAEKQPKGRIQRTSIPKTTLIDRKTGDVIPDKPEFHQNVNQHPEDKEIVQRINRFLIEGQWRYSNLLGKENHRGMQFKRERSPRDAQFPEAFALVSPQMRTNYKQNAQDFIHLIESPRKIKMVHDTLGFGLTPTLSRYFVFGLFGLTKNLQTSLYAVGFATDKIVEERKDEIYYQILKTFIEATNEELADMRRREAVRKKQLGRRIREPETIQDDSFLFPKILFCKADKLMENACSRIKIEFSVSFELKASFTQRYEVMKARFYRHQLKKQKAILQKGQFVVKKMLQSNNPKDLQMGIAELNQHNEDFRRRYRKFNLGVLCLQNFQKNFVGFNVYQRFQQPMFDYLQKLIIGKNGDTLKRFLDNIVQQEEYQKIVIKRPYEDKGGQLTHNQRLRKLRTIVEPNVLHEIIEMYKIGESLKYEKISPDRYTIGSGKRIKKTVVQFKHQLWKCQCGFQVKIGIPCSHLMRVLHCEKNTKYEDYINKNHYKTNSPAFVELTD